jgi:hypothetical protein
VLAQGEEWRITFGRLGVPLRAALPLRMHTDPDSTARTAAAGPVRAALERLPGYAARQRECLHGGCAAALGLILAPDTFDRLLSPRPHPLDARVQTELMAHNHEQADGRRSQIETDARIYTDA